MWYIIVNVDCNHLAEVLFARILLFKVTCASPLPHTFPHCTFWEDVSICTPYLGRGSYAPFPWGQSIYINYLIFSCMGDLSPLLYLFTHLYQYGLIGIYFIHWVLIQFYFVAQIVPAVTIESSFIWLLCLFGILPSLWGVVWALPYFLTLQVPPGSSYTVPATVLESAIFPRSPGSFYWRIVLETKIWVLGELFATGIFLLLGPLTWPSKEIWVYNTPCVYTQL